jgi:signal peptidase I
MTDTTEDAAATPNPQPAPSRGRAAWLFARDILLILLAAILISFLVKTFLVRSFYIPSGSMEDTLFDGDRILVNELVPDISPIQRGDVVVFRDPGGWLEALPPDGRTPLEQGVDTVLGVIGFTAPDSDEHLVKRVIGLPGDHVVCCGNFGAVRVNDVPLDESYIVVPDGEDADPYRFDVTVPEGMIWVMGDNRYASADSAYHHDSPDAPDGFVPIDDVVGRAIVITWPVSRWTWLDDYEIVFRGVEPE